MRWRTLVRMDDEALERLEAELTAKLAQIAELQREAAILAGQILAENRRRRVTPLRPPGE